MAESEKVVGKPISRVDGRLKVTGQARYAAETKVPNVAYGVLVTSGVAKGRVTNIDTAAAEKAPGVLAVITHRNAEKAALPASAKAMVDPAAGHPIQPLQDDRVHYHGQPIAVVVADTFERATHAASLVRAAYQEEKAVTDFAAAAAKAFTPTPSKGDEKKPPDYTRGDPDKALAAAEVRVEQTYTTPAENHNPMELHATVAVWDGDKLTLYDKTQWVDNVQKQVAAAFGLKVENVRVVSPFVGGAFGQALRAWVHTFLAALAAKQVGRPVKVVLTRAQMYTVPGYRPATTQKVALGATRDGTLTAIRHAGTGETSTHEEYTESLLNPTRFLYACPNVGTRYRLAAMNVNTPASMRAPGEASGVFALECALDELAVALKIDPLELRLRNHADRDPETDKPWSSKSLKECYKQGAEKFGWSRRPPGPRATRDGQNLIGWGLASATWPAHRMPATVRVRLLADGTAVVQTAAHDIGPGTYTVMTQIAAEALGLPVERVRIELGDTKFPPSPVEGGSMTVASVGSAVHEAAAAARDEVRKLGGGENESFAEVLKRNRRDAVEVTHASKPTGKSKFSSRAFGAHFVEVKVDADLGTVRVNRVVTALAAGRIINPKTAHSQAIGGVVGGMGMALWEEVVRDRRNAGVVTANLADYLVPGHADVPDLDAFYVPEEDTHVNPIGAKGLAELSLVGVAAAVANAVWHATGKRVRDLPITPDKLL